MVHCVTMTLCLQLIFLDEIVFFLCFFLHFYFSTGKNESLSEHFALHINWLILLSQLKLYLLYSFILKMIINNCFVGYFSFTHTQASAHFCILHYSQKSFESFMKWIAGKNKQEMKGEGKREIFRKMIQLVISVYLIFWYVRVWALQICMKWQKKKEKKKKLLSIARIKYPLIKTYCTMHNPLAHTHIFYVRNEGEKVKLRLVVEQQQWNC